MNIEEMKSKIEAVEDVMNELEISDRYVQDEMITYLTYLRDDICEFIKNYGG